MVKRWVALMLIIQPIMAITRYLSAPQIKTTAEITAERDSVTTQNLLANKPQAKTEEPVFNWVASYYGKGFFGRLTASGERYNETMLSCAHRTLPFHTKLHVTNQDNGKSVIVRVNDRGPFIKGRHLDLSFAAAKQLGMLRAGVIKTKVRIEKE